MISSLPSSNRRALVLTVAAAFFLLLLDSSILNTSLPRVADSMGVKPLALSPTITGYLLASVAAMPLSGWLSSRFGGRRVYVAAIAGFTVASMACGVSQELWQLVLARIVQGAAAGTMMTVGRSLALGDAEPSELMSVTSLLIWPALLAPVVGPPLGGWITTDFSWRWNFLLNVPLGLIGIGLVLRFVPPDVRRSTLPIDWRGVVLSVGGLAALFGGLELCAQAPGVAGAWPSALGLLVAGAVLLLMAVRHLVRVPQPLISLAPLRVKTFAVSTFAAGTYTASCLQAMPFLLPLAFQLSFGASPAKAGALLVPYFLGNLLMKSATTPVLRRFGFKNVLIADGVVAMGLTGLCGVLDAGTPWLVAATVLIAAGAARSMLLTALNTLCYADVAVAERPAAATLSSISMLLSQSLGIVMVTLMLAATEAAGGRSSPDGGDFRLAFFGIGAVGLVSVALYSSLSAHAGAAVSGRGVASAASR